MVTITMTTIATSRVLKPQRHFSENQYNIVFSVNRHQRLVGSMKSGNPSAFGFPPRFHILHLHEFLVSASHHDISPTPGHSPNPVLKIQSDLGRIDVLARLPLGPALDPQLRSRPCLCSF